LHGAGPEERATCALFESHPFRCALSGCPLG
jgi:hypothetical protein